MLTTWKLLGTVQSIVLLSSCADGLGRSKDILAPRSLVIVLKVCQIVGQLLLHHYRADRSRQKYYASNILYVSASTLSKASVAYFLLQLTPINQQRRFVHMLLGFVAAWGIAFVFVVALICDISRPWLLLEEQCTDYVSSSSQVRYIPSCIYLSGHQVTPMADHGIFGLCARNGGIWNVSLACLELEDKSQQ